MFVIAYVRRTWHAFTRLKTTICMIKVVHNLKWVAQDCNIGNKLISTRKKVEHTLVF